ncbi:hypothetical protein PINS_up013909 [Pythium insidiosum]|nr:hypothetical protein PINS_up013909 [Pythium insidiosum]
MDFSNPVSALALCADGKTLAVGTTSGEILVFDLRGVITPLFSIAAHETAAVNALHFASPIADAASALQSAAVLPQGQPVISTDRSGDSMQEIVNRKLEAMGLVVDTTRPSSPTGVSRVEPFALAQRESAPAERETAAMRSSSRVNGFTISTEPSRPEKAPAHDDAAIIDSVPDVSPPSTSPLKQLLRHASEPSLLSLLAESSQPPSPERPSSPVPTRNSLPIVSPTNYAAKGLLSPRSFDDDSTATTTSISAQDAQTRREIHAEIEAFRETSERLRQQQEDGMTAFVERLLARIDALASDNGQLRRENASLHALLRQHVASNQQEPSHSNEPQPVELSTAWRQAMRPR